MLVHKENSLVLHQWMQPSFYSKKWKDRGSKGDYKGMKKSLDLDWERILEEMDPNMQLQIFPSYCEKAKDIFIPKHVHYQEYLQSHKKLFIEWFSSLSVK